MGYCRNCGAYIPIGEQRCLACGYIDSTAKAIAVGQNDDGAKTVLKDTVRAERPVTRYSSQRRKSGKGAERRYSSEIKNSEIAGRDPERGNLVE